ncbi:MAG: mechanosensitive ion channel family protein [Kiritimatiellae bacterium]|nr:mechanosensitive ion channel family protein [Kiritimatiellia bacterium]
MNQVAEFFKEVTPAAILGRVVPAVLVLAVTFVLGRVAGRFFRALVRRVPRADVTVERLAGKTVAWTIWMLGALAALGALGVDTKGVLAAFGALAIAVGLGLKDTLSNVAAGIEIIFLRPIAVGEFVSFQNLAESRSAGTVERIGLFFSEFRTPEGLYISVPNRILLEEPILNYSRNPERQIRLVFPIAYSDSIETGLRTLLALGEAEKRRLPEKPVEIFVDGLADSSVNLALRVWVAKEDYWPALRDLTKNGKEALAAAGLTIPFPQRDVHVLNG